MGIPAVRDEALMPSTFGGMMQQAEALVASGLLPAEVKTPAAAVAIMLTGRELGIPPMQAFRSIYVVKGTPTLSAQLMGALILRAGHSYKMIENTNERCIIDFRRRGGETYRHEFTAADAQRAGLTTATWKAYPKAMLFSRCMSAGARVCMPDVLAGMYTPEELADPDTVVIDEVGAVIAVAEQPPVVEVAQADEPEPQDAPTGWDAWSGKARRAFWAKVDELGLTEDVLHVAFGVDTMKEYGGTMLDASTVLKALDLACNERGIGVAGLTEALGRPVHAAVADGMTWEQVHAAVEDWLAAKLEPEAQQEGLEI